VARLPLFVLTVVLLGSPIPVVHAADAGITVGVLAFRGDDLARQRWEPTTNYLSTSLAGYSFKLLPLDLHEMNDALVRGDIDFILTNPGNYVELEARYGATRIATLKNVRQGRAYVEFGAVIFTRAARTDIRELGDLKHASFAAVDPNAFGGFEMAWRELAEAGLDPFRDLRVLKFVGFPQDEVVYQVRDGKADAGTVRTDVLERMASRGLIDLDEFRVLNPRITEGFPFRHSTRLYPEWAFAKARHTSDELAKEVTIALLKLPADHPAAVAGRHAGWTVPLDYQPVHELFRELRIGPYAYLGEMTLGGILQRYWYWFAAVLVVLAFGIFHDIWVKRLVRQRTADLVKTNRALEDEVGERKRAEEKSQSLLAENRFLIRKSLSVQEEERRHLARELHDEFGQCITAIQADMAIIRERAIACDARLATSAAAVQEISARLYDDVHSMMQRLRPSMLDDLGLAETLRGEVDAWQQRQPDTTCSLEIGADLDDLGEQLNMTIYRIIQECLTNISKHAAARHVSIALQRKAASGGGGQMAENAAECVRLVVRDDGTGFDPAARGSGLGLIGMRERVEGLNGWFRVASKPGGGSTVSIDLPLSVGEAGES
jgi:two-component system sensor histidine kinase TtrS